MNVARSGIRPPVLVVSPHLDDAVFSCGGWIAAHPGSLVVTVFAGSPADGTVSTDWDRRCGFAQAAEAVDARRHEDVRALSRLKAEPLWLDFVDAQYQPAPPATDVVDELARVFDELLPQLVLAPMGLFHSDHLLVHRASLAALRRIVPAPRWLVYEDALYRAIPGVLQKRLAELGADGLVATPARLAPGSSYHGAKAHAVQAYASQLRAFGPTGHADAAQPERFWRLEPADAASDASQPAAAAQADAG